MQRTTRLVITTATLVLAGCGGSNDTTGPGSGGGGGGGGGGGSAAFSAQVSGDLQQTIGGTATFGSGTDSQGNTLHMIQLSEGGSTPGGTIVFARQGAAGFSAGSYPIVDGSNGPVADGDVIAVWTDMNGSQLTAAFAASGGTLTVTSSSGSRVAGNFTFQATGAVLANPGATLAVDVTGDFTADPALGSLRVNAARTH